MNFPWWLLALYLVKGAELYSTERGIDRGCVELNFLARTAGARIALAAAGPLVVELSARKLTRAGHPRWALVLRVGVIAGWGYATVHNLRKSCARAP